MGYKLDKFLGQWEKSKRLTVFGLLGKITHKKFTSTWGNLSKYSNGLFIQFSLLKIMWKE